jgi:hypothetical protein
VLSLLFEKERELTDELSHAFCVLMMNARRGPARYWSMQHRRTAVRQKHAFYDHVMLTVPAAVGREAGKFF